MKVKVYRNLNKNVWSVVDVKTRRVILHAAELRLRDVEFRVQPGGNAQVRAEGRKNVHAYATGTLDALSLYSKVATDFHRVRYNPYTMKTFQTVEGVPIKHAKIAEFNNGGYAYASCQPETCILEGFDS